MQGVAGAWSERAPVFRALRPTIAGETMTEDYRTIGVRLGMSEGAVKKAAFDLRAVFTKKAVGFIRSNSRLPIIWCVPGVSGACIDTKSDSASSWSKGTYVRPASRSSASGFRRGLQ